jgi:cytochrome c oxidase subunit 4
MSGSHKPVPPTTYAVVFACLLGLTALTLWIATAFHLGGWEVPVALGIAATKTVLVGLVFMHLMHSSKLTWIVIGAGLLFLVAMIGITAADYLTRV